jgi:hypothetical protein
MQPTFDTLSENLRVGTAQDVAQDGVARHRVAQDRVAQHGAGEADC